MNIWDYIVEFFGYTFMILLIWVSFSLRRDEREAKKKLKDSGLVKLRSKLENLPEIDSVCIFKSEDYTEIYFEIYYKDLNKKQIGIKMMILIQYINLYMKNSSKLRLGIKN